MKFDLKEALKEYKTTDIPEQECVKRTLNLLNTDANCFSRKDFNGHIIGDAVLINEDGNILLNHHRKLNMWVFFGGHSDGEMNTLKVAERELQEESGITEYAYVDRKIFDVDIHTIPENPTKGEPEHLHYCIRFLFIAKNKEFTVSCESTEIQWKTIEEAKCLMKDYDKIRVLNKIEEFYKNRKK